MCPMAGLFVHPFGHTTGNLIKDLNIPIKRLVLNRLVWSRGGIKYNILSDNKGDFISRQIPKLLQPSHLLVKCGNEYAAVRLCKRAVTIKRITLSIQHGSTLTSFRIGTGCGTAFKRNVAAPKISIYTKYGL